MVYAIVLVVLVVGVGAFLARRGGGGALPGLPVPQPGAEVARVKLLHRSQDKTVNVQGLPEGELGRFTVYYLDDMLFYYGNGSKQHDNSGPLRQAVSEALADPAGSSWKYDPELSWTGESVDSTLYENAFSGGRVLGWSTQAECRRGGLQGLVARAVQGPDGDRVRKAVSKLLEWQETYGPRKDMTIRTARAHAAWNGIEPRA